MPDMKRTLVIGDVHGHYDRLEALLLQEGIIGWKVTDEDPYPDPVRINHDVEVVQLGDLGHFGSGASPTGDYLCYRAALEGWIDIVLWGNHDAAVFEPASQFRGYEFPKQETLETILALDKEERIKVAHEAYGFLITHAGLHKQFKYNKIPFENRDDPAMIAKWLNGYNVVGGSNNEGKMNIVLSVGRHRGGNSNYGGVLWRDFEESVYPIPQVYGHSASQMHKTRQKDQTYCIDIGGKGDWPGDNCLAGIYLPDLTEVRVDLGAQVLSR